MDNIFANYFLEFASIIILHIASAVGCGFIASKKNRSVPVWVILGLLFEIISLIIIAIIKPVDKRNSE